MARDREQKPNASSPASAGQHGRQIAPGKVTRTSKLAGHSAPAVQQRAAPGATSPQQGGAKSAWELTMSLEMDAAHRGVQALADHRAAPVQARASADRPATGDVHSAAAEGVRGSGQPLPYMEQIQSAFGASHDLSNVQAHIGGPTADACEQMGAVAYATGEQIAFAGAPNLHTAAHEAAHVVQQRQGVQLYGGLGAVGDQYERQADAVADAVVAGRSAEALLDRGATPGSASGGVQRKEAPQGAQGEAPQGESQAEERLVYSGSWIQEAIANSGLPRAEIERMAREAGMNTEEISALASGAALAMTAAQHASLQAALASAYARGPGQSDVTEDGTGGSVCGSSGNPSSQRVAPVTTAASYVTENAPGNTVHAGSVNGGTVTLRHEVDYSSGTSRWPSGFAVSYQGPDSQNAHWLQFIWREIVQKDGSNNVTAVTGPIRTTGGTYDLTSGGTMTAPGTPAENNYNTDTASSSDPFYEAGFTNNRTADASTIYDAPGAAVQIIQRAFTNGATEVKSRAHFSTFLVQTNRVTYKTETHLEWHYTSATATPSPTFRTGGNGAASQLAPDALRNRFHAQFPAFNFIR